MYDEESRQAVADARRPGRGSEAAELVAAAREARRSGRAGVRSRRAPGPRPVRPAVLAVSVRPAEGERPNTGAAPVGRPCPSRQRLLSRRMSMASPTAGPVARPLGGVLVAVLAAAVVVGLGQLLALSAEPAPAGPRPVGAVVSGGSAGLVEVGAEETVWEVARRVEPGAGGARLAELAERIAVVNSLDSVELRPGQRLRVPAG